MFKEAYRLVLVVCVTFFIGIPLKKIVHIFGPGENGKSWLTQFFEGFFVDAGESDSSDQEEPRQNAVLWNKYCTEGASYIKEDKSRVGQGFTRLNKSRLHLVKEYRDSEGKLCTRLLNIVTGMCAPISSF